MTIVCEKIYGTESELEKFTYINVQINQQVRNISFIYSPLN